jgi:hypothetical protein
VAISIVFSPVKKSVFFLLNYPYGGFRIKAYVILRLESTNPIPWWWILREKKVVNPIPSDWRCGCPPLRWTRITCRQHGEEDSLSTVIWTIDCERERGMYEQSG